MSQHEFRSDLALPQVNELAPLKWTIHFTDHNTLKLGFKTMIENNSALAKNPVEEPKTELESASPVPLTNLNVEETEIVPAIANPTTPAVHSNALPSSIPQDVLEHVSEHPPRYHRAMQLKLQGMKLQEICDELGGISVSTCQNWIRKVAVEYTQLIQGSTSLNFLVSELWKIDQIEAQAASDMANTKSPNQRSELMKVQLQCSRQRFSLLTKSGLVAQAPERLFLSVQSNAPKSLEKDDEVIATTPEERTAQRAKLIGSLISNLANRKSMSTK
ncbi:MAG: hypothetical protein COA78_05665 [Blastopirellula sp.]|nr:MAG: hypothetical protein COA78_05665 [Blastopirellula sp.]